MIGLLRKELYGLNTLYKKSLLMVAVIYGVLIFTTKNDFFLYFGIFVMTFYSISNLSLDDSSGWGRYARTLPVSDRAVVGAKFVASFLYLLGGALFGLAVGTLRRVVNREGGYGEMLLSAILTALCCLLVVFILYPCAFKFGLEKARNGIFVVWMLIFGGFLLFGERLEAILPFAQVIESVNTHPWTWLFGLLGVLLLGMVLCFFLSCRIYRNKEF